MGQGTAPVCHATGDGQQECLRILVVDDNPDITEALSILLEMLGHQVSTDNGARHALARLDLEPMDLCLLDIGMPEMDGLELARRIRARVDRVQPVLIAFTGFGEPSDRAAAMAAGFDRFMVKPLQAAALMAVLDEVRPLCTARARADEGQPVQEHQ